MPRYDNIASAIPAGSFGSGWTSHSAPLGLDAMEPNAFGSQFDEVDEAIESLVKSGKLYQFNPNAYLANRQSYDPHRFGQQNSSGSSSPAPSNDMNRFQAMNHGYQNLALNRSNLNKSHLNSFSSGNNASGQGSSRLTSGHNHPNGNGHGFSFNAGSSTSNVAENVQPQGFNNGSGLHQPTNHAESLVPSGALGVSVGAAPIFATSRSGTPGQIFTPQVTAQQKVSTQSVSGRDCTTRAYLPAVAVASTTSNISGINTNANNATGQKAQATKVQRPLVLQNQQHPAAPFGSAYSNGVNPRIQAGASISNIAQTGVLADVQAQPIRSVSTLNGNAATASLLADLPTISSNKLISSSIASPPARALSATNRIKNSSPKLSFDPFSSASDFSSGLFFNESQGPASPPSSLSSSSSRKCPQHAASITRPGSVGSSFTPETPVSLGDSFNNLNPSISSFSGVLSSTNNGGTGGDTTDIGNALTSLNLESDDFFPSSLSQGLKGLSQNIGTIGKSSSAIPPSSAPVGWSNTKAFGGKPFGMTTTSVWG